MTIFSRLNHYRNSNNNFEPSLLESFLRYPIDYNALKYNFIPYFETILNRSYSSSLHKKIITDTLTEHFKNIQFDKDLQSMIPYILMIDYNKRIEGNNILKMKSSILDKRRSLIFEFLDYIINRYDYDKFNNSQMFGIETPISKENFKDEIFFHLNDMIEHSSLYNRSLRNLQCDIKISGLLNDLYLEFYKEHIYLLNNLRKKFLINFYSSITKFIICTYQRYFKYKIREVRVLLKNYYFKDSIYNNYENYYMNYNPNTYDILYMLYAPKCSWKVSGDELSEVFTLVSFSYDYSECEYSDIIRDIFLIELILEDNSSVLLLKGVYNSRVDNFNIKHLCSIIVNKNDYVNLYNITYNGNLDNFINELKFYNDNDLSKILYTACIKEDQNIEITIQ